MALSTADLEAERLLSDANRAIAAQDRVGAWRALDLARSNYPEAAPAAQAGIEVLDRICSEGQKVGRTSVATWRNGKQAAVTMTFDDALRSGYRRAAPDLDRRGWLGTFYVIGEEFKSQELGPWISLAQRGHEIGFHTVSHRSLDLPTLSSDSIRSELNWDQLLTHIVTDDPILTFAYPGSNSGSHSGPLRAEVRRRYLAARSGMAGDGRRTSKASPDRMDHLISFHVRTGTKLTECAQGMTCALREQGWLIFTFHAIIDSDGWQPVGEALWRDCLQLVEGHEKAIWIAPLADVASYIQARRTARIDSAWDGGDRIRVIVRSDLDRTRPETQLTITVRVPGSWEEVEISSENDSRDVRDGAVTFNLRPDGRPVVLKRVVRLGRDGGDRNRLDQDPQWTPWSGSQAGRSVVNSKGMVMAYHRHLVADPSDLGISSLGLPRAGSAARVGSLDTAAAAPPFRMVPRYLVLSGTGQGEETNGRPQNDTRRSGGSDTDRIVLEYDESSGLVSPAWRSIRPEDARQRWSLQVSRQFDEVLAMLVHRGVPLVWLTTQWDWVGSNVLRPVNPRYLVEILKPVEVGPA